MSGLLRRTKLSLYKIPAAYDYARPRPVIRKTRSWRGLMQVRFDDSTSDRNTLLKHAFIWAPLRVLGIAVTCGTFSYFYFGHDQFMFMFFGYESEAMVEGRVNVAPQFNWDDILGHTKNCVSPLRKFEVDPHPMRTFDVFQKNPDGTPVMQHDRTTAWAEQRG